MNNEYTREMQTLKFSNKEKQEITDWLVQAAEDRRAIHPEFKVVPGGQAPLQANQASADFAKPNTPSAGPKRRRSMRWAVAAATLAALLLVGGAAWANGAFISVGQAFDYLFNGAPANTEVIDKIGRPVGASATSGGITLTADAIIGDAHTYSVVYSLVHEDGKPFENLPAPTDGGLIPIGFEHDLSLLNVFGGGGGSSWFYDADPNDAAIQYVEQYSWEPEDGSSIVGTTMNVDLKNLVAYTNEGSTPLAEGEWKMKFALNYEDSSVPLEVGQDFALNGMNATLSQAAISPISLYVSYAVDEAMPDTRAEVLDALQAEGEEVQETEDGTYTWSKTTVRSDEGGVTLSADGEEEAAISGRLSQESQDASDKFLDLGVIRLNFADGTSMEIEDNTGGTISDYMLDGTAADNTTQCYKSIVFDRVVDLDQVTSVEFCGLKIPVS